MTKKIDTDSDGIPYIIHCTIYHFYGEKPRDFFSIWVHQNKVVRTPPRWSAYQKQNINTAIDSLKTKGYNYEII